MDSRFYCMKLSIYHWADGYSCTENVCLQAYPFCPMHRACYPFTYDLFSLLALGNHLDLAKIIAKAFLPTGGVVDRVVKRSLWATKRRKLPSYDDISHRRRLAVQLHTSLPDPFPPLVWPM